MEYVIKKFVRLPIESRGVAIGCLYLVHNRLFCERSVRRTRKPITSRRALRHGHRGNSPSHSREDITRFREAAISTISALSAGVPTFMPDHVTVTLHGLQTKVFNDTLVSCSDITLPSSNRGQNVQPDPRGLHPREKAGPAVCFIVSKHHALHTTPFGIRWTLPTCITLQVGLTNCRSNGSAVQQLVHNDIDPGWYSIPTETAREARGYTYNLKKCFA